LAACKAAKFVFMVTVHLHQLIFHGFHGLYPGEEKIGNDFEVNLDVEYHVKKDKYDSLKHLVNYEEVYEIVKARMAVPTPLLEEIGDSIIGKIHHRFSNVTRITISIHKLNAPIQRFNGKVGISIDRIFD
jgi:dihydroneopterin aldolase